MKTPKLPTENIGQIILAVWIIFSVVFVGNSVWTNVQTNVAQQAASSGYQQAFIEIIQRADTCEVLPLTVGDAVVNIQKVGCAAQ